MPVPAPALPRRAAGHVAYFGILKAGGVAVPLNVLLKAPEVAFYLGDSGAKILITWGGVLGDAARGAAAAGVSEIYAVGHAGNAPVSPGENYRFGEQGVSRAAVPS